MTVPPFKVLIADPQRSARELIAKYLSLVFDEVKILSLTGSVNETIACVRKRPPDLIITEMIFHDGNSVDILNFVNQRRYKAKVLVLTPHVFLNVVKKLFKSGNNGFVTKQSGSMELLKGIQTVLNGQQYLCLETRTIIAKQLFFNKDMSGIESLSKEEIYLILGVRNGLTSVAIASSMNVSTYTIQGIRNKLRKRIGIKKIHEIFNYTNSLSIDLEEIYKILDR